MKALDRKKALKVIIISLLLDLLAFTIILPLFPRLLRMYDETEPEVAPTLTIELPIQIHSKDHHWTERER